MKYVGPLLLALFLCLSLQAQDQEEGFFVAHQCATSGLFDDCQTESITQHQR